MDDNAARVIIALIGLFATLLSSYVTHRVTADGSTAKIEALSRQAERAQADLDHAQSELSVLAPENERLEKALLEVTEKWKRCTTPGEVLVTSPSIADEWFVADAKTGDQIRFKLSSSSAFIQVVRVTKDGPIVELRGCEQPGILEGLRSPQDGRNAFLIPRGSGLTFSVSSECCEHGLATCSLRGLEQVDIVALEYDVDSQEARLKYRKVLM